MRLGDWLRSISAKNHSKIVLALDFDGPAGTRIERANSLLARAAGSIAAVKVNFHLLLPFGVRGLRQLTAKCSDEGLPVIADIKLNDIGSTNLDVVETLFSNGFDAVIANPFVGYREGMEDVIRRSHELGKGVILLVYMSHKGAKEGYGLEVGGEPMYFRFARKTRRWGADGAVVSAKSLQVIRRVKGLLSSDQVILSPGVGFQGGNASRALGAGADYLIVGRTITTAADPLEALRQLNSSTW